MRRLVLKMSVSEARERMAPWLARVAFGVFVVGAGGGCGGTAPEEEEEDRSPPSLPTNLTASASTPPAVHLSWSPSRDNVGVTGYVVRRDGEQIGTSASTSYTDTNVVAARSYLYSVSGQDAAGNVGPASEQASVTTP
jgi:hypothetical protein